MSTEFKSYSMFTEKKYEEDWYEWCVFVDGEMEAVEKIRAVEYKLHPTFPDPTRLITDKPHRFALTSSGWGGFVIKIMVIFEDGGRESANHLLKLHERDWPGKPPPAKFASPEANSVYQILTEGKYRWRKLRTVSNKAGLAEADAEVVLRELERQDYVRELPYRSIDGQPLWGATAIVGVSPRI